MLPPAYHPPQHEALGPGEQKKDDVEIAKTKQLELQSAAMRMKMELEEKLRVVEEELARRTEQLRLKELEVETTRQEALKAAAEEKKKTIEMLKAKDLELERARQWAANEKAELQQQIRSRDAVIARQAEWEQKVVEAVLRERAPIAAASAAIGNQNAAAAVAIPWNPFILQPVLPAAAAVPKPGLFCLSS